MPSAAVVTARSSAHPPAAFHQDYRGKTEPTRRSLEPLLHQTFAGGDDGASPESDLLLDPGPGRLVEDLEQERHLEQEEHGPES